MVWIHVIAAELDKLVETPIHFCQLTMIYEAIQEIGGVPSKGVIRQQHCTFACGQRDITKSEIRLTISDRTYFSSSLSFRRNQERTKIGNWPSVGSNQLTKSFNSLLIPSRVGEYGPLTQGVSASSLGSSFMTSSEIWPLSIAMMDMQYVTADPKKREWTTERRGTSIRYLSVASRSILSPLSRLRAYLRIVDGNNGYDIRQFSGWEAVEISFLQLNAPNQLLDSLAIIDVIGTCQGSSKRVTS